MYIGVESADETLPIAPIEKPIKLKPYIIAFVNLSVTKSLDISKPPPIDTAPAIKNAGFVNIATKAASEKVPLINPTPTEAPKVYTICKPRKSFIS